MHFGHCEVFSIFNVNLDTREIISREYLTPPPHEPGVLPAWLGEQSVNVIIAGGIGQRAVQLFDQAGIATIIGAPSDSPEQLALAYINGTL